jgi:hypothetical protein
MSLSLYVVLIVLCICFFLLVVRMVKKGKLAIRYSMLWFFLALIILIFAIFPNAAFAVSNFFGFETTSNFFLLIAVFFLLWITLNLSVIVSKQSEYIRSLVQTISLLDHDRRSGQDK